VTTLSVLGYNTHLFGNAISPALEKIIESLGLPPLIYEDVQRSAAMVPYFQGSGANILGLTEVWDDDLASFFTLQLSATYPYSYRPTEKNSYLGSGLLLLSTYPISNTQFYPYNDLTGFDAYSTKGILVAQVSPGGGASDLITILTHTQAGSSSDEVAARASNLSQLSLTAQDLEQQNSGLPLLIIGDLNVCAEAKPSWEPTAEYQNTLVPDLAAAQLSDVYRTLYPSAPDNPGVTYDAVDNLLIAIFAPDDTAQGLQQRIDYEFATSSLAATQASVVRSFVYSDPQTGKSTDLSDHYPLAASYTL
jgi:endonuclease/exonuclease/phosphatase family metal-dependent hydrolase